jgi:hypothetical protein
MNPTTIAELRLELSLKAKNGINFIVSAGIIWFALAYLWTMPYTSYNKSVLTFILSSFLLPLAFLFSKIFGTQWSVKDNPLDSLGLWFNFAQLFYFPFLIFILIKYPDYFLMTYGIITGAHFFPYSWFYNEIGYAVMAGIIPIGVMLIGLSNHIEKMYLIGIFTGICMMVLACWLYVGYRVKLSKVKP